MKITIANDSSFTLSFTSNNITSELYEILGYDINSVHIGSDSYTTEKVVNL